MKINEIFGRRRYKIEIRSVTMGDRSQQEVMKLSLLHYSLLVWIYLRHVIEVTLYCMITINTFCCDLFKRRLLPEG